MTYPLVSVGVAVYNGEKTIKKSLASIFNQTYKNLEILIIDDNSTDNSFTLSVSMQFFNFSFIF